MVEQTTLLNEGYASPFKRGQAKGNGPDVDATLNLAHAAEYAAAQLGAIARAAEKMALATEKIESHLAKIATSSAMNAALSHKGKL